MKYYLVQILSLLAFVSCAHEHQNNSIENSIDNSIDIIESKQKIDLAKFAAFYNSTKELDAFNFKYESAERKNFIRFPGTRKGIQITTLSKDQRIVLHNLLNDLLSSQGYFKLLGIISNEDASARVEEDLGRAKYWLTFFGNPEKTANWGFRFEGHLLQLYQFFLK